MKVLIVGGTGPSGVPIVNNFLHAGYEVTIYHTGKHEAQFDADVAHLHGDPRDADDIHARIGAAEWDVAICTSGRLRALALELAGKTRRLVGHHGPAGLSRHAAPHAIRHVTAAGAGVGGAATRCAELHGQGR